MASKSEVLSFALCALAALSTALAANAPASTKGSEWAEEQTWLDHHMVQSFHELSALDSNGKKTRFKAMEGKVVLVANVASECGYTEQHYKEFRELKNQFRDDLVIVAFPCNQFGAQEPGTMAEIKEFAEGKQFNGLLMDKVSVNGVGKQHPVFKFLKESSRNVAPISWNFEKFLVRPDGTVQGRYSAQTSPLELSTQIRRILQ